MDEKNPWIKLHSEIKYENPWISLTEHQVLNPAGKPGIYGVVHFKNLAIGIIALDDNYNLTLVGQFRFALDAYSWELPEGGGSLETTPLDSARRELLEETGLVAGQWQELMRLHLSNSVSDELAIIYLARDLSQQQACPEETEQLQILKIPFEEAYQLVSAGQITDAITVAAILKLKIMIFEHSIDL